ncbi:MAG: hypothetical protein VX850_01215, partial [Gemmatimonadota bacterium]|nr:hypothetical protein [Gemmatimonadota bacterium]MEC9317110.1 hypothetical protein [Gemmatimonadota bacterium]
MPYPNSAEGVRKAELTRTSPRGACGNTCSDNPLKTELLTIGVLTPVNSDPPWASAVTTGSPIKKT